MEATIQIGIWHELKSSDMRQCPSYYAADWEVLRTKPGDYPLQLVLWGGYTYPMPQWLVARIDADRIEGRLYSGFGGNNFASRELPKEPKPYIIQTYAYNLADLVEKGWVTVFPEFEGLIKDKHEWARDKTWEDIKALGEIKR